jgi:outer membrane biosynthesis protein TonB
MQWIFDNLQILIAGAALVAYWLNNMRQAKEEAARERQEAEAEAEDVFGPDFDFGTPQDDPASRPAAPQPPPMPQAGPPPILRQTRTAPTPPTPSAVETELARQQAIQERLRLAREARQARPANTTGGAAATQARTSNRGGAAATQARVTGRTATSSATPASASTSLARRLRDRSEIRRAIVLREILGPPPGLH